MKQNLEDFFEGPFTERAVKTYEKPVWVLCEKCNKPLSVNGVMIVGGRFQECPPLQDSLMK